MDTSMQYLNEDYMVYIKETLETCKFEHNYEN